MWRNYSPKTFLRQTPNSILKEYFASKNLLTDIDFDSLKETEIDTIAQSIDELPEKQRTNIEAECRQINEMSYDKGVRTLIEEAGSPFHNIDLSETFQQMKNHYERAMVVFLNHPRVFGIASDLAFMDRISYWKPCNVGVGLTPAVEPKDLENLAKAVSDFYKKQGRGRHCRVDNYLRSNPERHCYFTYPEDYATTDTGYDEEGRYTHWFRRPAFEVVFVYKPEDGSLEVGAKGKTDEIKKLQEIFCQTILSLDSLPEEKGRHFELSRLKDKNLNFVTEPQDGVENVVVTMLRLDLPGMGRKRITLEASPTSEGQPIHSLIEKAINKANVPFDKVLISRAKLQIRFAAKDGKRGKTLTFEISPDRWTLKDDPIHQIAKKYIEKWGLISG